MADIIEIVSDESPGVPTITLRGDVDSYAAPTVRDSLRRYGTSAERGISVNLSEVRYMDSAGLAILVDTFRSLLRDGKTMALVAPSEQAHRVLQVTGLDRVFPTFGTETEAAKYVIGNS